MKRLKKIEGDQLPIDELLPEAPKGDHKLIRLRSYTTSTFYYRGTQPSKIFDDLNDLNEQNETLRSQN